MKHSCTTWLIVACSCLSILMGSCSDSDNNDDTTTLNASTLIGLKLVSDSTNDIYLAGRTNTDLDSNSANGNNDLFLIKYSADGTRLWSRLVGSEENDYLQGITITSMDQTVMTGYTYGTLDSSSGGVDMLLVKTTATGDKIWEKQFGTSADDYAYGVTTDASGDIYVTGHTYGSFEGTITGTKDFVLLKFDSSGDQIWARQLGNDEDGSFSAAYGTYGIDVKTDEAGNIYGAGFTSGTLTGNTSRGKFDLFVVKYDPAGNRAWVTQLGSAGDDYIRSLQVTAAGDIYLTGYTNAGLDGQSHAGLTDIFLIKLNTGGTLEWTRQVGTDGNDYGNDIAVDHSGDIYLTGQTNGALGSENLGGSDFVMMKYDASGDLSWAKQLGTTSNEVARAITIDESSDVYIAGYTYGELDGNSNTDLVYTSFLSRYDTSGDLGWTITF